VRPGGVVAYVTCSPHLVETRVTVAEAVRRAPYPVEQIDVRPLLPPGMPGLGEGPSAQLWPHLHGTDAMFVALLRRPAPSA
jgi:16S rRNA (cytosine967-C5)-methyltransferase